MNLLCTLLAASALAKTPLPNAPTETLIVYETGRYEVATDNRGLAKLTGTVEEMESNGWLVLEDKDLLVLFHDSVSRKAKYEVLRQSYAYLAGLSPNQATVPFSDFPRSLQQTLKKELSSLRFGSRRLEPVPTTQFGTQPYATLKIESPHLTGPVRLTVFGDREESMSPTLKTRSLTLTESPENTGAQQGGADWDTQDLGSISIASIGRRSLRGNSSTSKLMSRAWTLLEAWQKQTEFDIDSKRSGAFDKLVEELRAQNLKQLHTGQLAGSLPGSEVERLLSYLQSNGTHGAALSLTDAQRALQTARVTAISRGIALSFACPSPSGGYSIGLILIP